MNFGSIRTSVMGFLRALGDLFLDAMFQTRRRNKTVAELLREQLNDKRVEVIRLSERLEQEARSHEATRASAARQLEEANSRATAEAMSNEFLRARVKALEDTVAGLRRQQRRR